MEDALVHSLRRIVAHDAGDSDLHLSLVEPGLEAPQAAFRARGVRWEVEPMQRQPGLQHHFSRAHNCAGRRLSYQVATATTSVMMPSTMNSHFQPKRPATPRSCKSPLAISPLTALAIFYSHHKEILIISLFMSEL